MKHLTQPIDFCKVQEFVTKFENEYPHLYLQLTLDEVAFFLAQPHITQWDSNPDKALVDRFKLGIFADWVQANQMVEISF